MTGQDLAALLVCGVAALFLAHRLWRIFAPPRRRPGGAPGCGTACPGCGPSRPSGGTPGEECPP